uniref:DUF676 domain-containing protein n=1 Tax=Chromera velia CCMP2878 TaxID=1169474 RepID=A0A0G4HFN2_9ALVE|eukprot:Cvel_27101.t1-p1 / transcript=Cvel_27101.t1 / gene=Cvel_27101 / organism=Chromera_velia_CCMP2878 / gene_product=hypothetical protein / transcript_product=hypothetical protein / location=Cvel_scaffold3323:10963-15915(-) / protein_length=658 / sequence_SO=supercontig / SO=protein_coding / is_pseudo=false
MIQELVRRNTEAEDQTNADSENPERDPSNCFFLLLLDSLLITDMANEILSLLAAPFLWTSRCLASVWHALLNVFTGIYLFFVRGRYDQELRNSDEPKHLIVLSHGMHGSPRTMDYLAEKLFERFASAGEPVVVHKIHSNFSAAMKSHFHTADGVHAGGRRAAREILQVIQKYPSLETFSCLGNSLGGLYMRYAISLLFGEPQEIEALAKISFPDRLHGNLPSGSSSVSLSGQSRDRDLREKDPTNSALTQTRAVSPDRDREGETRRRRRNDNPSEQQPEEEAAPLPHGVSDPLPSPSSVSAALFSQHLEKLFDRRTRTVREIRGNLIAGKLRPHVFITTVSPHVGVRGGLPFPLGTAAEVGYGEVADWVVLALRRWLVRLGVFLHIFDESVGAGGWTEGRYGETLSQLLLRDEHGLLERMAEEGGVYVEALRLFEHRICYANGRHDSLVPACSQALLHRCPTEAFSPPDSPPFSAYPHVVAVRRTEARVRRNSQGGSPIAKNVKKGGKGKQKRAEEEGETGETGEPQRGPEHDPLLFSCTETETDGEEESEGRGKEGNKTRQKKAGVVWRDRRHGHGEYGADTEEGKMMATLRSLGWTHVVALFEEYPWRVFSHNTLPVCRRWLSKILVGVPKEGLDVADHLADFFPLPRRDPLSRPS